MYRTLKSWEVAVLKELGVLDVSGSPVSKYAAGFDGKKIKVASYQKIFYYALTELGKTTPLNTEIAIKYLGLIEASLYFTGYIPVKPPFTKKGNSIRIPLGDALEILETVEFPRITTSVGPVEGCYTKNHMGKPIHYIIEEIVELPKEEVSAVATKYALKKWQVESLIKLNVLDDNKVPTEEYKKYFVDDSLVLVDPKFYPELYKQALAQIPEDTNLRYLDAGLSEAYLILVKVPLALFNEFFPVQITAKNALKIYSTMEVPWIQTIKEAGIELETLIEKGILVDENTVAEEWKSEVYISSYYSNNIYHVTDKVISIC